MDEAKLEKYIKEKSNEVVTIRIIESLLGLEFASKQRLWQDVFVYVTKNYMHLDSYHDPRQRRDKLLLRREFDLAIFPAKMSGVDYNTVFASLF